MVAEQGVKVLLSVLKGIPVLGKVPELLSECLAYAEEVSEVYKYVKILERKVEGLAAFLHDARDTLPDKAVNPLEEELQEAITFLKFLQKTLPTPVKWIAKEQVKGKVDELNLNLDNKQSLLTNYQLLETNKKADELKKGQDEVKDELKKGHVELREVKEQLQQVTEQLGPTKHSQAPGAVYAYVAVQRPPVVAGRAASLTSFASCLADMKEFLTKEKERDEWFNLDFYPVYLGDGVRRRCAGSPHGFTSQGCESDSWFLSTVGKG